MLAKVTQNNCFSVLRFGKLVVNFLDETFLAVQVILQLLEILIVEIWVVFAQIGHLGVHVQGIYPDLIHELL